MKETFYSKVSAGVVQLQRVNDKKISLARTMRSTMTQAEKKLWAELRGKKCSSLKFRRQQIVEGFIVDFFCARFNLVIEVDGKIHETDAQKAIDTHRRHVFESRGLREIRFSNEEVLGNIEMVKKRIIQECF